MSDTRVSARPRAEAGKGPNRRLRAGGLIPAVVYGRSVESRSLAVRPEHLTDIIRSPRGVNTIFSLEIEGDGKAEQVMIHDYQLHPLDHSLLHADLLRVELDKVAVWQVPVHLVGESVGVKRGGHLDFVTRSLAVACRPGDIPVNLPLEVAALDYGDTVRASDIELPGELELATEPEVVVVHVSAPKVGDDEDEDEEKEAAAEGASEGAAEGTPAAADAGEGAAE